MTSMTKTHLHPVARTSDSPDLLAPWLLRQPDNLERLLGLLDQARREQQAAARRRDELAPYRELLRALKSA
jgi:hypothetical protein